MFVSSLESSSKTSKSAHELRGGGIYETLPRSLKEPVLVGATVEDPEVTKERATLARAKTPSQLAEFHGIGDIPIPGLWAHNTAERPQRKKKKAKEVPEEPKKPGTLSRPCVVRSKVGKGHNRQRQHCSRALLFLD